MESNLRYPIMRLFLPHFRACESQELRYPISRKGETIPCEKRSNAAAVPLLVLSSRILRPSRNGMLCIMVTPQTALRERKANSQIPRGLDAVQDMRQVYVLVPVTAPGRRISAVKHDTVPVALKLQGIGLEREAKGKGRGRRPSRISSKRARPHAMLTMNEIKNLGECNARPCDARSSQVRSIEGGVKNGEGSRTEREEDDYSGSSCRIQTILHLRKLESSFKGYIFQNVTFIVPLKITFVSDDYGRESRAWNASSIAIGDIIILIEVPKLHFNNNRIINLNISRSIWINRLSRVRTRVFRNNVSSQMLRCSEMFELKEVEHMWHETGVPQYNGRNLCIIAHDVIVESTRVSRIFDEHVFPEYVVPLRKRHITVQVSRSNCLVPATSNSE
ncbi:hypothetical protein ALC62_09154 [Cyphomyrmex costatus]|uniref:Uncharacterized protein n=1 Tax=Cyphomyrmex costatus TaxID=456900 RepID=A0A195CI37_9HYME|nr:hypothetical protein ALC62_09154 [Cyphomyrmex costatus]